MKILLVLCLLSLSVVFAQNRTTSPTVGPTPSCGSSYCGNSRCEPWFDESCENCAYDCGMCPSCDNICGNLRCETGETACNCPGDCGSCCVDGMCNIGVENPVNCPQDCVGTLTGYVVNTNLTAIAGATVSCTSTFTARGQTVLQNVTTGADGFFRVANTSAGNYTCYAYATGFYPGSASANFLAGTSSYTLRIVLVGLVGSISGELRDARTGGYLRVVNVSCDTPFVAPGGITFNNLHKFASEKYFFEGLNAATYNCTASKAGWIPQSQTVTVVPSGNTIANFNLTQRPLFATGYVLDSRFLTTITPANVYCYSRPGNHSFNFNVVSNGFYNVSVTPGYTYLCEASATDYLNNTFTLDCDYKKNVTLTPLKCLVSVYTVDTSTGKPLGTVNLDFHSANISNSATDANGFYQVNTRSWDYSYVTGTKTGYLSDWAIIYCNSNGTANVTLYLTPLPNRITILVLDERTGLPITFAKTNLAVGNFSTKNVNSTGYSEYFPVFSGTYTASASATGYTSNSTGVPRVEFNDTRNVVIYLKEALCNLTIIVYDTSTNSTLNQAVLFIFPTPTQFTTGADGTYSQNVFADLATGYNASKSGYTSESGAIQCARNRTVVQRVYLTPLPNRITVEVLDFDTRQPLQAYIRLASTAAGIFENVQQAQSNGRYTWTPVPAATYKAFASLAGYSDNNTDVGTVERNGTLFAQILLRSLPCIVNVDVLDGDTDNLAPLVGALVTFNSSPVVNGTTTGTTLQFTFPYNFSATTVFGFKDGYESDFDNFNCSRGSVTNVTLILFPQPNNIFIQVRDIDTNFLITTAYVTLFRNNNVSDSAGSPVDSNATAAFLDVLAGTYTTSVGAPGYAQNNTGVGTVLRNQNISIIVYLRALACSLIVSVVDSKTGLPVPGANVTFNSATLIGGATPDSGNLSYTIGQSETANRVTATKIGYTVDSGNFTCGKNVSTVVVLRITALLNTVNIIVRDIRTNDFINTAFVSLAGFSSSAKGVLAPNATATFTDVPAGTNYRALASAAGYADNSTNVPEVKFNDTVTVTVYLGENPCVVNVITYDNSTGAILPNTTITYGTTVSFTDNTDARLRLTFSGNYPSGFVATKEGYSASNFSVNCTKGSVSNISVYLSPLPNELVIQVRESLNDTALFEAAVSLSGTVSRAAEDVEQTNATVTYKPLGNGTYFANASADGYYPNSTGPIILTRNQRVFRVIYLTPYPCIVNVQVLAIGDNQTTSPIPGVTITNTWNRTQSGLTTDNFGYVTYTFAPNAVGDVFAVSPNIDNATDSFYCYNGAVINITLITQRFFTVRVAAVDAYQTTRTYLRNATIFADNVVVSQRNPANDNEFLLKIPRIPYTVKSLSALSKGYIQGNRSNILFTENVTFAFISLAPKQFTLYFTPVELVDNGTVTERLFASAGVTTSGFIAPNDTTYSPSTATVGGSAYRWKNGSIEAQTYNPNFYFPGSTEDEAGYYYAANFTSITPTADAKFFLTTDSSPTGYLTNYNNTVKDSILIYVPGFPTTEDRDLLIPVPVKRNQGFMIVQVAAFDSAGAYSTFPDSLVLVKPFYAGGTNDYQSLFGVTTHSASFEFTVAFNTVVTDFVVSAPTEFFDLSKTTFPNITFPFTFPTQRFRDQLFITEPNGQVARKPNSVLYEVFVANIFKIPGAGGKRSN